MRNSLIMINIVKLGLCSILTVFLIISSPLFAQQREQNSESNSTSNGEKQHKKSSFWEKAFIEPEVGVSVLNSGVALNLSPALGYRVKPKFIVGSGPIFQYLSLPYDNVGTRYRQTNWGAKAFTRLYVSNSLFATVEFQGIFMKQRIFNNDPNYNFEYKQNTIFPVGFIGAGYVQGGGNGMIGNGFNIRLLYEFLHNPNSPYRQGNVGVEHLWLSVGYGFGLY